MKLSSTGTSAEAALPQATAPTIGEAFIPANESAIVAAKACPLEMVTLWFACPSQHCFQTWRTQQQNQFQHQYNTQPPPHRHPNYVRPFDEIKKKKKSLNLKQEKKLSMELKEPFSIPISIYTVIFLFLK